MVRKFQNFAISNFNIHSKSFSLDTGIPYCSVCAKIANTNEHQQASRSGSNTSWKICQKFWRNFENHLDPAAKGTKQILKRQKLHEI
jgi:hypothetical protein